MARRPPASDDVKHDETNPNQEEIVMTDDMERQPRNTDPDSGGKDDSPAKDPFHNVILFPGRRKEGSNQEPPPSAA